MEKKDKQANEAGNINKTGGSYKEKQPAEKPKPGSKEEQPVDEDGDAKADHSMSNKTKKNK